jgi:threonine dehydrogenase-like Zn-dependent dehydrogenase
MHSEEPRVVRAIRGYRGQPLLVHLDDAPGEGEMITMRAAGICASDLGYLALGTERVLGHELAGIRDDGTPVVVEGLFGCGQCSYCHEGRNNLCVDASSKALGIMQDGGMAEQFRAPSHKLLPLPPGLNVTDACLVEPASVAWHGVRLAGITDQTRVAVVGGGSIGLLATVSAQTQRAGEVHLAARHRHQHEIRERFGIGEPRGVYDVVVEAAGSPSSLQLSAELVRPGGTIIILGVSFGALHIPYPQLLAKEATLIASKGYCGFAGTREMTLAAGMLASRPEVIDALISHRFPLEDAPEAFRVAANRKSGAVKVVIHLDDTAV